MALFKSTSTQLISPLYLSLYSLINYAKKNGVDSEIQPWDTPYWSERMRENKFNLKEEELKPYFSLDNVLRELFAIANRLFGIYIQEMTVSHNMWLLPGGRARRCPKLRRLKHCHDNFSSP